MLASTAYAGDPCKDLYGNIDTFSRSKRIKVRYNDYKTATEDCKRLGFKVREDYKPGSFLICDFNSYISIQALVKLTSCKSVKHVSPAPLERAL